MFHDEFHRACTHVVHRTGCCYRRRTHLRAQRFRHAGSGCFFQHFLVPPLHRAVPLKQVHAVALAIAKHLDFNMARALHIFFDQHRTIAKAAHRLALATGQSACKVCRGFDNAHALAAAARAGLDEHRIANAVCLALQERRVLVGAVVARHQRHAGALHQLLGLGLQTHGANGAGRRPDKRQTRVSTGLGKGVVLAQETIAGVNGLRTTRQRRLNDGLPAQVAVFGRAAANVHRLVAHLYMARLGIGIRIHGHGLNTQTRSRCRHTASDFAAVGDEDFGEHDVLKCWNGLGLGLATCKPCRVQALAAPWRSTQQ